MASVFEEGQAVEVKQHDGEWRLATVREDTGGAIVWVRFDERENLYSGFSRSRVRPAKGA